MEAIKAGCFAVDFAPTPEKLSYILDHAEQHRPWYDDFTWEDPTQRRALANRHLAHIAVTGRIWEVWRGAKIVGILSLGDVVARSDATCHLLFLDHVLADKKDLCINTMRWAFERLDLHRLSVEIPTYARALAKFARKLGFRYEAEGRQPYAHKDERLEPLGLAKAYIGSRRFQATLYNGSWHDVYLLSLLREEFFDLHGRTSQISDGHSADIRAAEQDQPRGPDEVGSSPRASGPEYRLPASILPQPEQHSGASPAS